MSGSTTPVTVGGTVATPLSLTPAELATLPMVTVNVTVSGVAESYSGVSVYALLKAAGFQYSTAKNGFLQDYIQVTDVTGRSVVLSEGEVDPGFGGAATTDIVAYSLNGVAIAPTLVVPGDVNGGLGGRGLVDLATLRVGQAVVPAGPFTAQAPYPTLTVTGAGAAPVTDNLAAVQALPAVVQADSFAAGTTPQRYTFTGATLFDVLGAAGLNTSSPQLLDEYAVATGSDGYSAVYALGEIDPAYRAGSVPLVAYDDGTGTFPTIGGNAGVFRSTAPGDGKGGRYVSDLASLTVEVACFRHGTRILCPGGEVAVECIQTGDLVVTAGGAVRPVRWVGRRSYAGRFLRANPRVQPVRFRAGSLGAGVPRRDLLVSPDHAMFLHGVLVPAGLLVNGTTIVRERELARVDYVHLELDAHDVILAEGAASESFVDDNSRNTFHTTDGWPGTAPATFCAERVDSGPKLQAIRRDLDTPAARAA